MKIISQRLWILSSCSALLVSCAVGPNFITPESPNVVDWSATEDSTYSTEERDISKWWTIFNDPSLTQLVDKAQSSNLDLRIAASRVREARAQYGRSVSAILPSGAAKASFARSENSANSISPSATSLGKPRNLYETGFDASWEIDIFGGLRRELEAAEAEVAATEEAYQGSIVSLVAEVARNYFDLRGLQNQLNISHKNISAQQQVLNISSARYKAGLVSELDVAQAQAQLESTKAQVPGLESEIKSRMFTLALLLAEPPQKLFADLSNSKPLASLPIEIPVGLPSQLLQRRPDIRQAQARARSANAKVGVAVSEWFPKFSLTGSSGFASGKSSSWFQSDSNQWLVSPSLRWGILDPGRIRANVLVQNEREEQAIANYEKAVLSAFGDVERALTEYSKEKVRNGSLARAVKASQRSYQISNDLYNKGLADFVRVLDAERSLFQAEDQLAQSNRLLYSKLVSIYKSLGGGWNKDRTT